MEETFERIYELNAWEQGSGKGSLPSTTGMYRRCVEQLIRNDEVRVVLDIGCGDWQFSRLIDWSNVRYIGVDIVQSVVENNRLHFGGPNVTFIHGNILCMPLPEADLVLVKDVLQHWSNQTIWKFLSRFASYSMVLITNSTELAPRWGGFARPDIDIADGQVRPLDLRLPPFNLPCEEVLVYDAHDSVDTEADIKTSLLWCAMSGNQK